MKFLITYIKILPIISFSFVLSTIGIKLSHIMVITLNTVLIITVLLIGYCLLVVSNKNRILLERLINFIIVLITIIFIILIFFVLIG